MIDVKMKVNAHAGTVVIIALSIKSSLNRKQFWLYITAPYFHATSHRPVEAEDGQVDLEISFAYPPKIDDPSPAAKFRFRNFKRSASEPLSVALNKIADSLAKNGGGGGGGGGKGRFNKKDKKNPKKAFYGFGTSSLRTVNSPADASENNDAVTKEAPDNDAVTKEASENKDAAANEAAYTAEAFASSASPTATSIFSNGFLHPSSGLRVPEVALWSGDALLTSDLASNSDGFKAGSRLQIDNHFYHVLYDPPAVKSFKLHKSRIVAGCPYAPQV